jgi:hypothetical protein
LLPLPDSIAMGTCLNSCIGSLTDRVCAVPTEGLFTLEAIAFESAELTALSSSPSFSRFPLEKVEALVGLVAALSSFGGFS